MTLCHRSSSLGISKILFRQNTVAPNAKDRKTGEHGHGHRTKPTPPKARAHAPAKTPRLNHKSHASSTKRRAICGPFYGFFVRRWLLVLFKRVDASQGETSTLDWVAELSRQSLFRLGRNGGKSGLHRTGRQVTPGGREPTESATENIPPARLLP